MKWIISWPVAHALYWIGHYSEQLDFGWLYQKAMSGSFYVSEWGGVALWEFIDPNTPTEK